jgi:hypothetical protein
MNREAFNRSCEENLKPLRETLVCLIEMLKPEDLRVFLTDAYDNNVPVMECTVGEMIQDIVRQLTGIGGFFDTCIYLIAETRSDTPVA